MFWIYLCVFYLLHCFNLFAIKTRHLNAELKRCTYILTYKNVLIFQSTQIQIPFQPTVVFLACATEYKYSLWCELHYCDKLNGKVWGRMKKTDFQRQNECSGTA